MPMSNDNTFEFTRHIITVAPDVKLHYVAAGQDGPLVVLLHGYPQTWKAWSGVIPVLVGAGMSVIAVDYRGAGDSSKPLSGYDKRTMAADIDAIITAVRKPNQLLVVVGHDIGMMIGVTYAFEFPAALTGLVLVDAPIPGTSGFSALRGNPRLWHFAFHGARDIPEMLTAGRESDYIASFIRERISVPGAVSTADIETYGQVYARPGAMRAGFELYRAFPEDEEFVRERLGTVGRMATSVLAVGGELSLSSTLLGEMASEISTDSRLEIVPGAGHWIPDQAPDYLAQLIIDFVQGGNQ